MELVLLLLLWWTIRARRKTYTPEQFEELKKGSLPTSLEEVTDRDGTPLRRL